MLNTRLSSSFWLLLQDGLNLCRVFAGALNLQRGFCFEQRSLCMEFLRGVVPTACLDVLKGCPLAGDSAFEVVCAELFEPDVGLLKQCLTDLRHAITKKC
jgi:hypothetical protein